MNSKNVLFSAVLMASSGMALGQHAGHQAPPSSPPPASENRTPAQEMSPASAGVVDRLSERLELARQSNDPAQMRAALDEVQNSLGELKRYAAETSETPESTSMGGMPGMAPPPKSPPSGKTKEMDHSQMDMSGKDNSMKGMPGMNAPAKKAPPASASPEGKETKEPICFKEVDTQGAEKATYKSKTYYFCSRADREKFLSDPAAYVNH